MVSAAWQERKDELDCMMAEGDSLRVIGKWYGVSRTRIGQVVKELGIKTRAQRKIEADLYRQSHNLTIHLSAGKHCTRCREYKFYWEFTVSKQQKDGRDAYCRKCRAADASRQYYADGYRKAYSQEWQRLNPDKQRRYVLNWQRRRHANSELRAEFNARKRRRYLEDPVFKERILAQNREYYRRRTARRAEEKSA